MARQSKVEACIFCDTIPCSCDGAKPVKKAATPRRKTDVVTASTILDEPEVPKSEAARAAMKAMVSTNSQSDIETLAQHKRWHWPTVSEKPEAPAEQDDEMDTAIRVLLQAEMLHPDEVEKYKHLTPSELDEIRNEYKRLLGEKNAGVQ